MRVEIACVVCAIAGCGRIAFDPLGDNGLDGDSGVPPGAYARTIIITAGSADVPAGYSISLVVDHAALVTQGKSRPDGRDLGVLRASSDIDRVLDPGWAWNSTTTRIWIRTATVIPAGTTNTEHVLVYGRAATTPAENTDNVFLFADDFETGLTRWQVGAGSWSTTTAAARRGASGIEMTGPLAGQNRWIEAVGLKESNAACEAYWHVTGAAGNDLGQGVRSEAMAAPRHYLVNLESTNGLALAKDSPTGFTTLSPYVTPPAANTWTRVAIMIADRNARVLVDDVQVVPAMGSIDVGTELTTGSVSLYAFALGAGESWWVDDLFARRYVDPEPTATLGPEVQN